jgi:hypothetical protein
MNNTTATALPIHTVDARYDLTQAVWVEPFQA